MALIKMMQRISFEQKTSKANDEGVVSHTNTVDVVVTESLKITYVSHDSIFEYSYFALY